MDADVADQVIGRPSESFSPVPATLSGYKRVYVTDATYPGIVLAPDSAVNGLLFSGISNDEAARLNAFEGPDYETRTVSVALANGEDVEARVFVPVPTLALTDKPWSLEEWQNTEKVTFLDGMTRGELV